MTAISLYRPETLPAPETNPRAKIEAKNLAAYFGPKDVVRGVNLPIYEGAVTAIIGPSGCGKSTFLRCLNRMHEETAGARVTGTISLEGQNIYDPRVDPVRLRRHVGMVFQKPTPFPTMSIRENVLAGLRLNGLRVAANDSLVEETLRGAALWDEVKDSLDRPGVSLSGGQQQRLCIARSLAMKPQVLLMDEPCSALDPIATAKIEELISQLRGKYTIGIVTHNLQQALRVADYTAFFLMGDLVEFGPTQALFSKPKNEQTRAYLSGRFG
jgi:phosphate transport system ATP-binding protein